MLTMREGIVRIKALLQALCQKQSHRSTIILLCQSVLVSDHLDWLEHLIFQCMKTWEDYQSKLITLATTLAITMALTEWK